MRISDWSSDVCSSDLLGPGVGVGAVGGVGGEDGDAVVCCGRVHAASVANEGLRAAAGMRTLRPVPIAPWIFLDSSLRPERSPELSGLTALDPRTAQRWPSARGHAGRTRSEEHTSELQSLMRTSYAVFCLTKNKTLKS